MKSFKSIGDCGDILWKNSKGQLHREDGPAIIEPDGDKHWYIKGQLHREDGPAWVGGNDQSPHYSECEYYVDGKYCCDEEEYKKNFSKKD